MYSDREVVCRGTLMFVDVPLGELEINEADHISFRKLEQDPRYYPLEMRESQTAYSLLRFFEERVTPKTRQGLMQRLRQAGFNRYSIAAILLATNGRDCQDPYWIRMVDGPQTWSEVWAAVGMEAEEWTDPTTLAK